MHFFLSFSNILLPITFYFNDKSFCLLTYESYMAADKLNFHKSVKSQNLYN